MFMLNIKVLSPILILIIFAVWRLHGGGLSDDLRHCKHQVLNCFTSSLTLWFLYQLNFASSWDWAQFGFRLSRLCCCYMSLCWIYFCVWSPVMKDERNMQITITSYVIFVLMTNCCVTWVDDAWCLHATGCRLLSRSSRRRIWASQNWSKCLSSSPN